MLYALVFILGAIFGIVIAVTLLQPDAPTPQPVPPTANVAETEAVQVEPVYVQQPTHWYNPVSRKPERRG